MVNLTRSRVLSGTPNSKLRKLVLSEAKDPKSEIPLTLADLRAGESARIACIECEHAARCDRLIAYGLSAGRRITLIQRSPAFVIRVDETELALDAEIANCIQITRENE